MGMGNSVFLGERYSEQTLIESILASFYILDYGYIKNVNVDKTVDVVHAKRLKTMDGKTLNPTTTKAVEMLTIAGAGFSLQFDYKRGDKVLLLGLKNYIPKVDAVNAATETKSYQHYTRETIKALPLCVFNSQAQVTVKIENGTMKVQAAKDVEIVGTQNVKITGNQKIELNGNSKQFVTYAELNNALQDLWTQIKNHTHPVSTTGSSSAQTGTASASTTLQPVTLDLSASKTTTVVTGG